MDVTVINENSVEVSIDPPETIVIEVDQGKAGRGIVSVTYEPDGSVYYLEITYTDGSTELVGPIPVDEPATLVNYYIKASAAITKGDLVMFTGAVGGAGVLQGAPASASLAEGLVVMGIASETMAHNGFGYVTSFGLVSGIDTTGSAVGETWADGDILYYNPNYVGRLTKVRPTSPAEVVVVAAVIKSNAGNGSLFIRVSFYPKLAELSDVYAPSPANNNLISWNSSNNRWQDTNSISVTSVVENGYPVVSQADIGTAPNEIPLNQYLGNLAYQNANAIAGNVAISVNSSSDALRITQTGAGNALVVEDSANPDASPFLIDASGNVVIGTTTPSLTTYPLYVESSGGIFTSTGSNVAATSPAIATSRRRTSLASVVGNDSLGKFSGFGWDGASFIEAARIESFVDGTPGTNDMPGRLVFSTTADGASTPTERLRIDSSGNLLIGLTSATSGGGVLEVSNGITFPAVQSASTNANTLDDYKEGTWSPALTFGGANTGITYTTQQGRYTKIGNQVSFSIYIVLSSKGTATGVAAVSLPVTSGTGAEWITPMALHSMTTAQAVPWGLIPASSSTVGIYADNSTTAAPVQSTDTGFGNSSVIRVSGTYFV